MKEQQSPSKELIRKLISNRPALIGLIVIFAFLMVSILGPLIRIDNTAKANNQHLELSRKKPGFKTTFLIFDNEETISNGGLNYWLFGSTSFNQEIPIHANWIKGDSIYIEKVSNREVKEVKAYPFNHWKDGFNPDLHLKSRIYPLGTDRYGRDLLSRLMAGTWISFTVGAISIFISLLIGISLGLIAAFFGGKIDDLIVWLINVVWSVPTLLLVIAITLALGKGFWQVFIAVGLTMWVEVARIVRGQAISVKQKEFIEAARSFGFNNMRQMFKHILPNISGPIIVISASNFAAAILIEAGLSFLGLGAQPPQATWGRMISEHKGYIITGDAYLAIFPGLAICILVLSFVLLGNGLRDAFDYKGSKSLNL